ncbi:hypothetical protein RM572_00480 [Streptomyces sp. DSM 42041]|uniref:ParB/Sulfiredoxin domain-containing protein n=1 Tax=Streptomyces hazeniae TaxID=3075538 RepID=A0ABU2NMG9_9ACTN|nr:hypothetical protein [Streptomyces sp. DSM 42041]MDT0377252.1 hypothetical protein [Streptomyces sp. DSM 42041]
MTTPAEYLRTADVPLGDLTPFPGNAKVGDVDAIRASLRRNGQYRALVVREVEDGQLIVLAGNHTLTALTAEQQTSARCEIVRCDEHTARRINLADNRTADLGRYDSDALAELLTGLDGDLDGVGYTDADLDALLAPGEAFAALPLDHPAPANTGPRGGHDGEDGDEDEGDVVELPALPATEAHYAETDEEQAERAQASAHHTTHTARGVVEMILVYPLEDREEAARIIASTREVFGPEARASEIVLRALRALAALLDSRHAPEEPVTVAALLKAAGIEEATE